MNTLDPITLTREASDILCGGTTLNNVINEIFPKTKIKFNPMLVPSFNSAKKFAKELKKNKNALPQWHTFKQLSDIISYNKEILADNLEYLKKNKKKLKKGVFIGKKVKLHSNIVLDASAGPIIIEDEVEIKPFSYIVGPLYLGKGTIVAAHSYIRLSSIGKYCKIGGEVVGMIFENYSNKTHHGCMADGYVGSWVNLGGGTSSSSLKNTYGKVKVKGQETDEYFIGPIIADYVKTAINTSIYTAKVIGIASHVYGTVTEDVPSFVNHVSTGKLFELPLEIAIKTQKGMSARRNISFTKTDQEHFEKLFKQTETDRVKAGVKKEKLTFSNKN